MPNPPVLVVDDDLDIRETVVQLLEDEGYVVFAAEHGASALSRLRGIDPPCVVLLDLFMPVLDGKGFLDRHFRPWITPLEQNRLGIGLD